MDNNYRHFFDIDPDYFPAVNADVIKHNPDLWKKFYPHSTFVSLIKDTISVLTRTQKLNIWVEGAYGTGKSHAVLTLKRLLDAKEQEITEYFQEFKLENDLLNKFLSAKNQGKILTVHRYGSSSIYGDNDLFLAIQESIEEALKEAGISNQASSSMKEAVINYLSDEENKNSFAVYVNGSYKNLFAGASVDEIVKNLSTFSGVALQELMGKIFRVAHEKQIHAFKLTDKILCAWIREVIEANNLSNIVFIWDEFTEYFKNNFDTQTGFQHILELSETAPFSFILVTHKSEALIADSSQRSKVLGRFIRPTRIIELPENMAFELMGAAMQKKNDDVLLDEWDNIIGDLCERTVESRKIVKTIAKIDDNTLQGVLPIHPYTACLLKHISTSFESNQRSMFDFIKNAKGGENKGFCWFIDNYGPYGDHPLLTIDMLWGFFYDMGKENLAQNIRMILDNYPRLCASKKLNEEEERVLKAILLMQALSVEVNDAVDIFLATEKNLSNAFEGSDLENEAVKCAEKLVRDNVIYKKPMGADKFVYSILTAEWDNSKINDSKKTFENQSTSILVKEGNVAEFIELTDALRLRFKAYHACLDDFDTVLSKAKGDLTTIRNKIQVIFLYAKDDVEASILTQRVSEVRAKANDDSIVFVSTTKSALGKPKFDEWVGYKAQASLFSGKDNQQAQYYANYAGNILKEWKMKIVKGSFELYCQELANVEHHPTMDSLLGALRNITVKRYPLCLDQFGVNNNLWICTTLKQGVESALNEDLKGVYNSGNTTNKLSVVLGSVWQKPMYWESIPSYHISKIKIALNQFVDDRLEKNGRISIQEIYEFLKPAPYGFLACNFTAFMIGFLMKEYVKSGSFSYSDELSSEELTGAKFQEMVEEIIKLDNTPNPRYRNKYIVAVTPEEKAFFTSTSRTFDISRQYCTSVENTRTYIRNKMKELAFPLWTLKYALDEIPEATDKEDLCILLEHYCNLANNDKNASGKSDNDIAMEIGKIILTDDKLIEQLAVVLTRNNCTLGMELYLKNFYSELLTVAAAIKDGGQYINVLRNKFDADAANWVWKQDTADSKIKELICEYKVIKATADLFQNPCTSYRDAIMLWTSRCSNMHLAYKVIKSYVSQLNDLLTRLYYLSKSSTALTPIQNEAFLQEIQNQGKEFLTLYANQTVYFKKACAISLSALSDSDQDTVFSKLPTNCFTMEEFDYNSRVESIVKDYLQQLDSIHLRNLWEEKTGTDSPKAWSEKYKVPMQIMMSEAEWSENKRYFDCLNSASSDSATVKKALSFFEGFTGWDMLNDATARDNAFKTVIIGDRAILLDDIDAIKKYLASHLSFEVYEWCHYSTIKTTLDEMFQEKYMKDGYNKAFAKIDTMNPDDAKQYLKNLIKNNARVGVEIIRSK